MDGSGNDFESSHPFFAIEEDSFTLGNAGAYIFQLTTILSGETDYDVFLSNEMKKKCCL
jgi:hypothetical protein